MRISLQNWLANMMDVYPLLSKKLIDFSVGYFESCFCFGHCLSKRPFTEIFELLKTVLTSTKFAT